MDQRVVVTGAGGPAGRSVASYLVGRGFEVTATDVRPVELRGARIRTVPAAGDPAFAAAVLDLVAEVRGTLLVPTVTEELPVVARIAAAVERTGCAVFISSPDAVDVAADKLETARLLAARGVRAPRSLPGELDRALIVEELGLPVLAKPRHGRGGRGVEVHATLADAERDRRPDLVFQEFLPGDEFDVNLFVGRDGRQTCAVLRKVALRGGIVGNATAVERAHREDVTRLAAETARELELEGPLDLDVRLARDGAPGVLEVNARPGANVLTAPEILDAMVASWQERG